MVERLIGKLEKQQQKLREEKEGRRSGEDAARRRSGTEISAVCGG